MNEQLQKLVRRVADYFANLDRKQKLLWGSFTGLGILAFIGLSVWMNQDPYQTLYTDLQVEESKAVVKKLSEQNIPYQLIDGQGTVQVPSSKLYIARMELAKAGLPGQDVVGFEKFDSTTLGMSSYVQRIQYVRAIQGELTRSIQRIGAVKRARVHISMPPKKTFLEEEDPPKASVVLELFSGQAPTKAEVQGIAHLVASAVEGLKVNHVTIVDSKGSFLHRPEDSSQGVSTTFLEMQRQIENDYEKRIEDLLVPVVGLGKVRAKVTAEMDMSRVNTMEETYDPDKVVAKSTLKNDEISQGSRPNPMGIPGSRSNLPGTEVQNPPMPVSNTSTEKNTHQTQYAVPKKVQTIDKPSGNIKRLTVAVVVDGHYTSAKDKNAPEVFAPRSEEELKRLQEIVANAVGFDSQRRDSITVSSLPFKVSEFEVDDRKELAPLLTWREMVKQSTKPILLSLCFLAFSLLVLRPLLRSALMPPIEQELKTYPRTVEELERAQGKEGILALNKPIPLEETEPMEKREEEGLKQKILERLDNSPRKGLRIIQEWLEDDIEVQAA